MLPTLFKKGNLKATKWSPKQEELDELIPLDYIMDWFKQRLKRNTSAADRILILKSATGSGKSAVLPPELYHRYFEDMRKDIASLQPRVYNAMDIPVNSVIPFHTKEALREANKPNRTPLELGENIGYQTGPITVQHVKGLIYMTIGTLMQQLNVMSDDEFMSKYGFIIIDEAHERSIYTDMVMKSMKMFVERNDKNPNCPFVVITSATFDTKKYCDYMLSSIPAPKRYANIIDIEGQTNYPIYEEFLKYDAKNIYDAVLDKVVQIHTENSEDFLGKKGGDETLLKKDKAMKLKRDTRFRDILIFVAGAADIREIHDRLNKLNLNHKFFKEYPILPIKLTGAIISSRTIDYQNLDKDIEQLHVEIQQEDKISIKKPTRRVIIATNVGETGITYRALKYVIDTGYMKSSEYDPVFSTEGLILKPITKGTHTQRKGRSGRCAPGYSYPMFTEKTYEALMEDAYPEILKKDIALDVLSMLIQEVDPKNELNQYNLSDIFGHQEDEAPFAQKNFRKDFTEAIHKRVIDITKVDILDLPSADSLHASIEKLYTLGAIDSNCVPTPVGFVINRFRKIPIESIRMILAGFAWNAPIIDLITMAAILSNNRDFRTRSNRVLKEVSRDNRVGAIGMTQKERSMFPGYASLRNSLLIADDFIGNLIIFHEFHMHIQTKVETAELKDLGSLEKWCEDRGVSFKSIASASQLRDEILYMMISAGFDPYYNKQKSLSSILNCYENCSRDDLMSYVKTMKQCIYEGYKLNIAEWNDSVKAYVSRHTHIFLPIDNPLVASKKDILDVSSNPRFIIYDGIFMQQNPKTNTYRATVTNISVLDGYVPI